MLHSTAWLISRAARLDDVFGAVGGSDAPGAILDTLARGEVTVGEAGRALPDLVATASPKHVRVLEPPASISAATCAAASIGLTFDARPLEDAAAWMAALSRVLGVAARRARRDSLWWS